LILQLPKNQFESIIAHARAAAPEECCGLIGGSDTRAQTIYPAKNVAVDRLVSYEAAAEDLFAAQRAMRERGEQLLAIYHSHPRATTPEPSPTDVRLAYYPSAVYLIVGLGNEQPCLRAFRIDERTGKWQTVEYEIIEGTSAETQSLNRA
jgi:[CysO sulfur-carrier protein]-S-L-cysteine hydrolase